MKPRFTVRQSPIHGRGVFARCKLRAGTRLLEYRGRRISRAAADRIATAGHTFLFTVNDSWVIDGAREGNSARWINHGCEPNCVAEIHVDIDGNERRDRVWIETLRDVRAGEELTFDYAIELREPVDAQARRTWACRCGARACRGTMLARTFHEVASNRLADGGRAKRSRE